MSNLILVEQKTPEIVIATLNRPEKRNALSVDLMQSLIDLLDQLEKDPQIRVLIVKGSGTTFCSGLDLEELQNPALTEKSSKNIELLFKRLCSSHLITIAIAHGAAMAGGAGILAACDFALGTPELKIGFPEVKKGLIPAIISTILARQVGWRNLRELLLIGDSITGTRAAEIGLLNDVVSEDKIHSAALQLAFSVVEGAPQAVQLTKNLLNTLYSKNFEDELSLAHQLHLKARSSPEALEGVQAFNEKRKPQWRSPL